jgi:thymidylate synthase
MDGKEKVFPVEEVRNRAVEIYNDFLWFTKDHTKAALLAKTTKKMWDEDYAREAKAFMEGIPDGDPELCYQAICYIVEHYDEVVTIASTQKTVIPVEIAERLGMGDLVDETIRSGDENVVLDTSGVKKH